MKKQTVSKEVDAFRRKKKKTDLFYPIYLGALAAAVIVLVVALVLLRGVLTEYEDSQAKYVAEEVFRDRFANFDYKNFTTDEIDPVTDSQLPSFSTNEEKMRYLNAAIEGMEISYFRQSGAQGDDDVYTVVAGNLKLAEFTVVPTGEKTEHGFKTYRAGSVTVYCLLEQIAVPETQPQTEKETEPETEPETDPPVLYTVSVTAPADAVVRINGTKLTEEYITDRTVRTDLILYGPDDFPGIGFVTYTVSGLEELPEEVTAENAEGKAVEVTSNEEKTSYEVPFTFSETLKERYSEFLITATQETAKYMQAAMTFDGIRRFYDPAFPRYEQLRAIGADAWMVNRYESVHFEDVSADEFYTFPDGSFRGRVSLVMIGTRGGMTSKEPFDLTFNFHEKDGQLLITASFNN